VKPQLVAKNALSRSTRRSVVAAILVALAGAPAATAAGVQVHARCAGDIVSGSVTAAAPGGVELTLLARRSSNGLFASTGRKLWVEVGRGRSNSFTFDVGRVAASAYRVDAAPARGNVVPAASCAPGHQVPEAPLALLLPLSVLGVIALTLGRRRLFGRHD
jgi:hypothetical protein